MSPKTVETASKASRVAALVLSIRLPVPLRTVLASPRRTPAEVAASAASPVNW